MAHKPTSSPHATAHAETRHLAFPAVLHIPLYLAAADMLQQSTFARLLLF